MERRFRTFIPLLLIFAMALSACAPARATQPAVSTPSPTPTSEPTPFTPPTAIPYWYPHYCTSVKPGDTKDNVIKRMLVGTGDSKSELEKEKWTYAVCPKMGQVKTETIASSGVIYEFSGFACTAESGEDAIGPAPAAATLCGTTPKP